MEFQRLGVVHIVLNSHREIQGKGLHQEEKRKKREIHIVKEHLNCFLDEPKVVLFSEETEFNFLNRLDM